MGIQMRSFRWTVLVLATVLAGVAHARTWHVEKDGSGDFTVIQDAVDVAEDGDIIMIGPGRYTEYTEYSWGNVYVDLLGDRSLTFVGAGVEQTIIGPDVYASGYTDYGISSERGSGLYRIENLRIENQNFRGLAMLNSAVELVDCVVERCYLGAQYVGDIQRVLIEDCRFINGPNQVSSRALSCKAPEIEIRNTEVNRYKSGFNLDYPGATDVLVTGCTFDANSFAEYYGLVGLQFTMGAGGTVENCYFTGWLNYAFAVNDAGTVVFRNNMVENCPGFGVGFSGSLDFTMHDSVITGCDTCVYMGQTNSRQLIHNNHFLRNTEVEGWYILTPEWYPFGPTHLDFTENYWGTTDPDEIAQWILDGHDDEDVWMYIDYLPMADGPVSTERTTWDSLKSMFRE